MQFFVGPEKLKQNQGIRPCLQIKEKYGGELKHSRGRIPTKLNESPGSTTSTR
jgi:hypothetical protein